MGSRNWASRQVRKGLGFMRVRSTSGNPGMSDVRTDEPTNPQHSILSTEGGADEQFLDDLSAANRLKSFLVGRGQQLSQDTSRDIGQLLLIFGGDIKQYEQNIRDQFVSGRKLFTRQTKIEQGSWILMPRPTPEGRALLDDIMQSLAALGDGLTIDDFRLRQILEANRTSRRVRIYIVVASILFMGIALAALYYAQSPSEEGGIVNKKYSIFLAASWALALGGLGAVASIFINILKLIPQQTLRTSDEFEVIGRIVLGFLFSTILATTVVAAELTSFFDQLRTGEIPKSGVLLLVPFLAGYSITLVLNLLEKAIQAIQLTIGLEDRRAIGMDTQRDLTKQRIGRRGRTWKDKTKLS
jgi:hypothetical protein